MKDKFMISFVSFSKYLLSIYCVPGQYTRHWRYRCEHSTKILGIFLVEGDSKHIGNYGMSESDK